VDHKVIASIWVLRCARLNVSASASLTLMSLQSVAWEKTAGCHLHHRSSSNTFLNKTSRSDQNRTDGVTIIPSKRGCTF